MILADFYGCQSHAVGARAHDVQQSVSDGLPTLDQRRSRPAVGIHGRQLTPGRLERSDLPAEFLACRT
ncbi:hypothetical protein DBB29_03260 [Pandoraea cepalis]|uniref:Uncharacterized protein n=1 Tax=Pandoraea cepalis TaxID=2508294 RepID=A0AAW7MJJ2_9BURK|nr:hypothetical protein [Pandoraea cepalis]MDN4577138.1 hypothetical protein [Pandoraea cepalis]